MANTIIKTTSILVFSTLGLFFIFYLFFKNDEYYSNSLKINSFVLPLIYAGIIFFINYNLMKKGDYSLRKGFSISFISLTVAGLISFGFIFGFIYYIDIETENLLTSQWFHTLKTNAIKDKPTNIKEIISSLEKAQKSGISFLNSKNLSIFCFMQFFFYTILSFFISFLIRTR
ncbi:MAG: DUF4199 family protein [Solirubrobacteraceae bacterium]